jgi:hypothetical protein
MNKIAKRRAARKQQNRARKIQRQHPKQKKNHSLGKKLTPEQKQLRSLQLSERQKFKQQRKQINKEKATTKEINRIQTTLSSIFNLEILNQLAKKTGFIKRPGEITAFAFMYIVSFGFLGNGEIALTYLAAGLCTHFGIVVTPQALSKRINSNSSPKYLKTVFQKLLGIQLQLGLKNYLSETFTMFNGIFLQDSSQIILNERLSEKFGGSGGAGSSSALKLDIVYDIVNFLIYGIKVTSAITNDQTNSKEILKYLKSGSLVIRDLGYFTIDCLRKIQQRGRGCYYLTRLSIGTNVYLSEKDDEPLNIPKHLQQLKREGKDSSNIKVYLGKVERLETRLVAEKVPPEVILKRSTKFKRDRKKVASSVYLEWCSYSIFITNIPETIFSGKMIIELYPIRWQIELTFKNFKSNVEINILKGTNENRIDSLVYGKLIMIVVIFITQNYAMSIAKDKEVSGDKLTKLLISDNRLRQAIIQNDISMLLVILGYDLMLVYKQKRNRKTTLENIKIALGREEKQKCTLMPLEVSVNSDFEKNEFQDAA